MLFNILVHSVNESWQFLAFLLFLQRLKQGTKMEGKDETTNKLPFNEDSF